MENCTEVLKFHYDNLEMWRLFKNIIGIIVFVNIYLYTFETMISQ